MTGLTVLVAPPGPADAVLDVLRDWSALDLLSDFVWVPAAGVTGPQIPGVLVSAGSVVAVQLSHLLAARGNEFEQLRICVLVPLFGTAPTVSSEVEQRVAQAVGGRAVTRLRVLIARTGSAAADPPVARGGWHNVLLAPEDSMGPSRGRVIPDADEPLADVGRLAAAGLAGVVGIWRGVDQSIFDGADQLPGQTVRLARSYYRRLQARGLERELRSRIASTERGLPLPVHNGVQAEYVGDVELATSTMAEALWTRHAKVLPGKRRSVPTESIPTRGFRQTLRLFFSFVWAALRNLPWAWYRGAVNKVSSKAAQAVHRTVYGSAPAAYRTVVNGRTDTGQPADWLELEAAASQVAQSLSPPGQPPVHEGRSDLGDLWRHFVAGGLTLADAGDRVEGMDPIDFGTKRGVLKSPADIAPGPSDAFRVAAGGIVGIANDEPLPAADVYGAQHLANRLRQAADEPAHALAAARAADDLRGWQARHRRSYVVQVGTVLQQRLDAVYREISEILARIAESAGSGNDDEAEKARQRKLGGVQRLLLLGLVIALVALGVAAGYRVLTGALLVGLVVFVMLAWLIAALVSFYRGQQALFAELERRQKATSQTEVDQLNLRDALRDQRRLSDAYHQYLAWSQVLGVVLHAPFGRVEARPEAAEQQFIGLPLSVRVGVAEVEEATMTEAVVALRRSLLDFGWLGGAWKSTLEAAPRTLSAEAAAQLDSPEALFSAQALDPESPLNQWTAALLAFGPGSASGDGLWAKVLDRLGGERQDLKWRLLGRVRDLGSANRIDAAEFMTGVDRMTPPPHTEHFDASVLAPRAQTEGNAAVVPGVAIRRSAGLSQLAVLTQVSEGLPAYALQLSAAAGEVDDVIPELDGSWATPVAAAASGPDNGAAGRRDADAAPPPPFPNLPDIAF